MNKVIVLTSLSLLIIVGASTQFTFDFNAFAKTNHGHYHTLKEQIQDGLTFNEILCLNNDHVLAQRTNGKLSCVYYETAEKLNWTIRDKEVKVNLLLNNDPAVKDCVPKKEGDVYPTMPYRNSTHSFDVGVCEWNLKIHHYEIEYDEVTFSNQYEITGAIVDEIKFYTDTISISLNESKNGYIQIVIPIELFDELKTSSSVSFVTIIDGEEVNYEQLSPNLLKISFEKGDKLIEILRF